MSNESEITKPSPQTLSELLATTDKSIYFALKYSVYPGAKDESIAMVLAYCKAKKYDPLSKAAYIVPMNVKDAVTKEFSYRDVIMPGVSSYRIDAERTGLYAGLSEPEFGPMITEKLSGKDFSYPEWCRITVKKILPNGNIGEFTAVEYWKENYTTTGKGSAYPNAMWEKRGRGQLAKCTEAQALRKALPGDISNVPTFEEMEGKELLTGSIDHATITDDSVLTHDQFITLTNKIHQHELSAMDICTNFKVDCLENLLAKSWPEVKNFVRKAIADKNTNDLPINKILESAPIEVEISKEATEFFGE
jgi:phage recombination protein Bet